MRKLTAFAAFLLLLSAVSTCFADSDISPNKLKRLTDVTISTPSNGQVLSYDSTAAKWVNSSPSSGSAVNVGLGTGSPLYHVVYTSSSTAGPSSSMVENSGGNIGIGSTAPGKLLDVGGASRFQGAMTFSPDGTYDIGTSGATRPNHIYAANDITTDGALIAGAGQKVIFGSQSRIYDSSDGVLLLTNNAVNNFSRLQFGGTTSSFPALRRNGTGIDIVNGDASAYTNMNVLGEIFNGTSRIFAGTNDGDLLFQNSGATTFGKIQLGGTTSSFPSIKRNATAVNFRLGDDSADAPITAGASTFSGNVGVGTAVTSYKLDVHGGASGTRVDLAVRNAANIYNAGILTDNDAYVSSNNGLQIYTGATERMRILSGGNVGIGTNVPAALTHILQTGAADAFRVDDVAGDTSRFIIDQNGNVGVGVSGTMNTLDVNGSMALGTSANSVALGSGDLTVSGNIGIGTWTGQTTQRLTIKTALTNPLITLFGNGLNGTAFQQGDIAVNSTSGFLIETPLNSGSTPLPFQVRSRNGEDPIIYANPNTQKVGIATSSPGSTLSVLGGISTGSFATSASPAGGIISSGNIGIGTTTPQGAFVVMGNVGIGTWSPGSAYLSMGPSATTRSAALGGSTNLAMLIKTIKPNTSSGVIIEGNSDDAGVSNRGGYIGLKCTKNNNGTTASAVGNNCGQYGWEGYSTDLSNAYFGLIGGRIKGVQTSTLSGDVYIATVDTTGTENEILTVTGGGGAAGNVGINSATPNTKLEVRGAAGNQFKISRDSFIQYLNIGAGAGTTTFTAANLSSASYPDFEFIQQNNSASRTAMLIDSTTGNVGIGTSIPEFSLKVTGTAGFSNLSASGVGDTYVCISTAKELRTGATCAASSIKIKEDIKDLAHGMDWVSKLRPVQFKFKPGYYNGSRSVGLIAEEVDEVSPLLSVRDEKGVVYSVHYDTITAVLIKALQEQDDRIAKLESQKGVNTPGFMWPIIFFLSLIGLGLIKQHHKESICKCHGKL